MVDGRVFLSFIWPLVLNESRVKRLIRVHFSVLCVCVRQWRIDLFVCAAALFHRRMEKSYNFIDTIPLYSV